MVTSLSDRIGQTLIWMPTATFKDRYDLIAPDGATLATLDMSSWTSKAHAAVPEGSLFLHKEGWTGLKVAIYAVEQGPLIATYQGKWTGTGGQLIFPDGHAFKWSKTNFWGTQKAWTDSTGNITYVQHATRSFSRKSTAVISPQAAAIPELSLLLVLGLYNILIEKRKAAANSASTSSQF